MDPKERASLVRAWRAFSKAYEWFFDKQDDAVDVYTSGDAVEDAEPTIRLTRTRATYLRHLIGTGLIKANEQVPGDDRLWEVHPINIATSGGADLYE